jgi:acetyl esterase
MPLDPQLEPINQVMTAGLPPRPGPEHPVDEMRNGLRMLSMALGEPEEVASVEDRVVPGPAGEIPVRIYRPEGEGLLGCLVFFHGGGFVLGDLESHDHLCRELANRSGGVVVAVDYRRAPEHPYPAAVDDCWAALGWVVDQAEALGIDPRAVAVGGDSAGGNLAAVAARRARDEGAPPLCFQLLVYPVIDLHDMGSWESRRRSGEGYALSSGLMEWFHDHYLGPDGPEPGDVDVSPILVEDLSGLPSAHVVLAEFDPLHDEGRAYADRLEAAGVAVDLVDYEGAVHIFFQLGPITEIGRRAVDTAADALAAAYDRATSP